MRHWSRESLLALIKSDSRLSQLYLWASDEIDTDPGHDLAHCLRVAQWAAYIAEQEGASPEEAIAAALLHDIVNVPKNSPLRAQASELSAQVALERLPTYGFAPDACLRIADAIRDHSYSRGAKPTASLSQALQDADRLEAIGVIGVFRCISTGVRMGARYFEPNDAFAAARPLDDMAYSIDHFENKLLKISDTLLTPSGRLEGIKRTRFVALTLVNLAEELGQPLPARLQDLIAPFI